MNDIFSQKCLPYPPSHTLIESILIGAFYYVISLYRVAHLQRRRAACSGFLVAGIPAHRGSVAHDEIVVADVHSEERDARGRHEAAEVWVGGQHGVACLFGLPPPWPLLSNRAVPFTVHSVPPT